MQIYFLAVQSKKNTSQNLKNENITKLHNRENTY